MGFLDHSTNNIIVDAVLTEKGRQLLAQNKLNIQGYSFGDDEVDYSLVVKYGETVGKEKIQKNTPIFEASTSTISPIQYFLYTDTNLSDGVEKLSTSEPQRSQNGQEYTFQVAYVRASTINSETVTIEVPELDIYWNSSHVNLQNDFANGATTVQGYEKVVRTPAGSNSLTLKFHINSDSDATWNSTVVRVTEPITGQTVFVSLTNQ